MSPPGRRWIGPPAFDVCPTVFEKRVQVIDAEAPINAKICPESYYGDCVKPRGKLSAKPGFDQSLCSTSTAQCPDECDLGDTSNHYCDCTPCSSSET